MAEWQLPRIGRLGRTTLLSTVALGIRAVLQAVYLIVVSRWLGSEGYGLFAGSVAAVVLLAPVATWGMGFTFTEHHARAPSQAGALWQSASRHAAGSALAFCVVIVVVCAITLRTRVPVVDLALLALAELLLLPWTQVATQALFALDRGRFAALATCAVPAFRVAAVLLLLAWGGTPSVHGVVLAHALGSFLGMALVMAWITRVAGLAIDATPERIAWLKEGAPFALAALAANAYFEVDKLLMLQVVGAQASGVYTAAFRVVAMLLLPIMALLAAALPRVFAAAHGGTMRRTVMAVTGSATAYAVVAAIVAWCLAPFVPHLFGPGFEATAWIVAWLAPWVPLFALHHCGALALVGDGAKRLRLLIDGTGLALVVALNVVLLPRYGAGGAIAALITVESMMALTCWCAYGVRRRLAVASH